MSIDDRLREADKSWNVMVIADVIVDIMREKPELTMLDIEDSFRRIGSKTTYLVAWPEVLMPRTSRPLKLDGSPARYALWVCINGENDLVHTLARFGLTMEGNRSALRETGFGTMGAA